MRKKEDMKKREQFVVACLEMAYADNYQTAVAAAHKAWAFDSEITRTKNYQRSTSELHRFFSQDKEKVEIYFANVKDATERYALPVIKRKASFTYEYNMKETLHIGKHSKIHTVNRLQPSFFGSVEISFDNHIDIAARLKIPVVAKIIIEQFIYLPGRNLKKCAAEDCGKLYYQTHQKRKFCSTNCRTRTGKRKSRERRN